MTEQSAAVVKFADIPDGAPFVHQGDVMIKLRLAEPDAASLDEGARGEDLRLVSDGYGYAWALRDSELRLISDGGILCHVYETVRQFDPDRIWT